MKPVRPVYVFVKALILFLLINVSFASFNIPVGRLTIYHWLVDGRLRFPYELRREFYRRGYDQPIFEDFDAMFASHEISRPKRSNEYRVILLGDSGIWGFNEQAPDMFSARLTAMDLKACGDKNIHVYNLAYPVTYLPKDLLILNEAMNYQPDMIVWMVTLKSFEHRPKDNDWDFISPHRQVLDRLSEQYHFVVALPRQSAPTFLDRTVYGQSKRLKNIAILQFNGLLWSATGIDFYVRPMPRTSNDLERDFSYDKYPAPVSEEVLAESWSMDALEAGYQIAGDVPVLVINEPIFIATGSNSDVRYNTYYPRWAYDAYRSHLSNWMKQNQHAYLDLWNALPDSEFGNTPLHHTPEGERHLAEIIAPSLLKNTCK